ncbi:hypothetical protein ACEQ8H_001335 [Pleosporales sp. CAS-2024a]
MEYLKLFLAVGAIGAVFSIINPTFTTEEVITSIQFLKPAAIFIAGRIGYRKNDDVLDSLIDSYGNKSMMLVGIATKVGDTDEGLITWDKFLETRIGNEHRILFQKHWAACHIDDTLCVQFTSGTTGPRKAAMVSHRNLLGNAWSVGHRLNTLVIPSDVFLAGATLNALSQESCTVILAVATMLQAILDHPEASAHTASICLRTGIVAGSTPSRIMLHRLAEEFSFAGLAYGYGMTEASCMVFLTDPLGQNLLENHTSVGSLLPHSSARVMDENRNILGPPWPSGRAPLITDESGQNWLCTGDVVEMDGQGKCTIVGRVKDMIKRGSENIFPSDIEKALEMHPDIEAAACVGIPDEQWGEIVGAFIKRRPVTQGSTEVGSKEMKLWLRKRIAPHKMPEHFFWLGHGAGVPDDFPSNHTGKLLKTELRAIARQILDTRGK